MSDTDPTLAVCMIVRDEAELLPGCLDSIAGLWDELIVVDTGSNDETVAIGDSYGATIGKYPWNNSFANARNYAKRIAVCDWIFVIDADERLTQQVVQNIRSLIQVAEQPAYVVPSRNYLSGISEEGSTRISPTYFEYDAFRTLLAPVSHAKAYVLTRTTRLYKNDPAYTYTGAIHNEIHRSILDTGAEIGVADQVVVHHFGMMLGDQTKKRERQIATSQRKFDDEPENIQAIYEYANILHQTNRHAEAEPLLQRVCAAYPVWGKPHIELGLVQTALGQTDVAIETYARILRIHPHYVDAGLNLLGLLRVQERWHESLGVAHMLTKMAPKDARAWNAKAAVYAGTGECWKALEHVRVALNLEPGLEDAQKNQAMLEEIFARERAAAPTNGDTIKVTRNPVPSVAVFDRLGSFSGLVVEELKRRGGEVLGPFVSVSQCQQATDVCYTDWCDEKNLHILSTTKPASRRLVANIYSYEAFQKIECHWPSVDHLIVQAQHTYEHALEFAGVPDTVPYTIQNRGINLDIWPVMESGDDKVITWVGYINWKKGPQLLVECAEYLDQFGYQIHVAGSFQDARSELCVRGCQTDNLHLHGWQDDVNGWLEEMKPRFHLCTSLMEGLPFNMMEAAAKGIQPLIYEYPGAKDDWPDVWRWRQPRELSYYYLFPEMLVGLLNDRIASGLGPRQWTIDHFNAAVNVPKIVDIILGIGPQMAKEHPDATQRTALVGTD